MSLSKMEGGIFLGRSWLVCVCVCMYQRWCACWFSFCREVCQNSASRILSCLERRREEDQMLGAVIALCVSPVYCVWGGLRDRYKG